MPLRWIVNVSVHDPERYPEYLAAALPGLKKFGANFIVRGGAYDAMEGNARERNFVIEFKDRATAMAWNTSGRSLSDRAIPTPI